MRRCELRIRFLQPPRGALVSQSGLRQRSALAQFAFPSKWRLMSNESDWPSLTQFAPGQRFANFTARVTSPKCSRVSRKSGVTTGFYIYSGDFVAPDAQPGLDSPAIAESSPVIQNIVWTADRFVEWIPEICRYLRNSGSYKWWFGRTHIDPKQFAGCCTLCEQGMLR
jgi:hypothetical protein